MTAIHLGLRYHYDYFIDFSFPIYVLNTYSTDRDLMFSITQAIGLFPSELPLLQRVIAILDGFDNLNSAQSYFLYQIHIVETMRQTTVSEEAEKIVEKLTTKVDELNSIIRHFWIESNRTRTHISIEPCRRIYERSMKLNLRFADAIDRFPNSQRLYTLYARFKAESMGHFEASTRMSKQGKAIETGKFHSVDHAFLSLCRNFPEYLFEGIVDPKGRMKSLHNESTLDLTTSSSSLTSHSSSTNELDDVACDFLHHGSLRMEIERALKHKSTKVIFNELLLTIIEFIIYMIAFIVMIVIFPPFARNSVAGAISSTIIHHIETDMEAAALATALVQSSYDPNTILKYVPTADLTAVSPYSNQQEFLIGLAEDIDQQLMDLGADCTKYPDLLPYIYVEPMDVLTDGEFVSQSMNAGMQGFILDSLKYRFDQSKPILDSMYTNTINVASRLQEVLKDAVVVSHESIQTIDSLFISIIIIVAVVCFLLFAIWNGVLIPLISKEYVSMTETLQHLDPNVFDKLFDPIMKDGKKIAQGRASMGITRTNTTKICFIIVNWVLLLIAITGFIITIVVIHADFEHLSEATNIFLHAGSRLPPLLHGLTMCVAGHAGIIDIGIAQNEINILKELISQNQSDFLDLIFDNQIALSHFSSTKVGRITSLVELVEGASSNSLLMICECLFNTITITPTVLQSDVFNQLLYTVSHYLMPCLIAEQDSLISDMNQAVDNTESTIVIIAVIVMILIMILFIWLLVITSFFDRAFQGVKQLVRILPPSIILSNYRILEFLNSSRDDQEEVTDSMNAILFGLSNPILVLNSAMVIDSCNQSFLKSTGYTIEQILGRKINWLIGMEFIIDESEEEVEVSIQCQRGLQVYLVTTIVSGGSVVLLLRSKANQDQIKDDIDLAADRTGKLSKTLKPAESVSSKGPVMALTINGLNEASGIMSPKDALAILRLINENVATNIEKFATLKIIREDEIMILGQETHPEDILLMAFELTDKIEIQEDQQITLSLGIAFGEVVHGEVKDGQELMLTGHGIDTAIAASELLDKGIAVNDAMKAALAHSKYFQFESLGMVDEKEIFTVTKSA